MSRKSRSLVLAALVSLPLMAATPPAGYNKLQDIWVFKDKLLGNWSGGDLYAPGSQVPVDTTQMYNGLPSLSFLILGPSQGWWSCQLVGDGWRAYSIQYYPPHGFLEFDVKGAAGGERFNIDLHDTDPSRSDLGTSSLNVGSYVTVSTSWQHVKIPISDFTAPAGFNFAQFRGVFFSESYSGPYAKQFWVNGIKFTSPDTEHNFPAIKVNQVGYTPLGTKYALVTGFAESISSVMVGTAFHVVRASDNKSVCDGTLTLVTDYDDLSGDRVFAADFSKLTDPGTYFIRVDASGVADSLQFDIGFGIFSQVLRDTMRYYYYQRQGIAIQEPYAEGFPRPMGHPSETAAYFRSIGTNGPTRDVSHGWYDAGDFGKYTADCGGVIVDLLNMYWLFPQLFFDGQNNIPESGNGKPDILDEVKWELDWLLKMQDSASGGFYAIVSAGDCLPGVSPCKPDSPTIPYIEDVAAGASSNLRPTASTAVSVAALARAADVFKTYSASLAASYLAAAEAGWAYLVANPNPISSVGLTYGQDTDADERLWAAGELFRTTQKQIYNTYFLANYQNFTSHFNNPTGAAYDTVFRAYIAYNLSPAADAQERSWYKTQFGIWRGTQMSRMASNPWRNFLLNYYWGSNSVTLGTIPVLVLGDMATGSPSSADVLDAARSQLSYILGVNPLRHSYVVGIGADSARTVFSGLYPPYGIYTPPAGYMGGGPNWYNAPWFSQFQARAFADSNVDWTINENAIGYEAPLVFTTAVVEAATINTLKATASGLTYSRATQTYNGTVTIKNTGLAAAAGPFQLLVTNLTSGVTLVGGSGQIGGSYYITISSPASLAPGQSVTVNVKFSDPSNAAIKFTPVITQGVL
jgi:endoglucanase